MTDQEGSKLLIDEAPLLVLPTLAARIGLNQAIVLQQIHYALKTLEGKLIEGRKWIWRNEKDWLAIFVFWSRNTVRAAFTALEKLGILLTGEYNELVTDRTKWYAIDYAKLNGLPEKKQRKKRSDYPNFGQSMIQRKRASKVRTLEGSNLGRSLPENPLPKTPEEIPLSPVEKTQATLSVETEKLNAVLEEVQKEQEAATPSNDLGLSEKKASVPPAPPPTLPKGTEPRYVSRQLDQESWSHVEHLVGSNVKTPTPVCKRCGEKLSDGIITQTPVPVQGRTYTRCIATAKPPKAPPINKPLLDAIAQHIEGIEPTLAGGLTGTLAGLAGQVWKRKLGLSNLNAEQYNSIARSIPRFIEWYNRECQGCSPPKDPKKFESWYAKFCSGPISTKNKEDPELDKQHEEQQKQAMKEAYGFEV